ncbi:hypothetical protein AB5I41_22730 [Sphingomonas sp. MMS24-JH45]
MAGIQRLVASAVPDLAASDVSVLDADGRVLSVDDPAGEAMSPDAERPDAGGALLSGAGADRGGLGDAGPALPAAGRGTAAARRSPAGRGAGWELVARLHAADRRGDGDAASARRGGTAARRHRRRPGARYGGGRHRPVPGRAGPGAIAAGRPACGAGRGRGGPRDQFRRCDGMGGAGAGRGRCGGPDRAAAQASRRGGPRGLHGAAARRDAGGGCACRALTDWRTSCAIWRRCRRATGGRSSPI